MGGCGKTKISRLNIFRRKRLFNQPIDPHALDDAGAVCASMIKAQRSGLYE